MLGVGYLILIAHVVLLGVCVLTFWRAGEMENPAERRLSVVWAGLSGIVYLLSWLVFDFGWPGIIGGQVVLLVGIGVVRAIAYLRETQK